MALHAAYGVMSLCLLFFAVFIWFATGNVLAPPCVWLLTMLSGVFGLELGLRAGDAAVWPEARYIVPLSILSLGLAAGGSVWGAGIRSRRTETELRGRADAVTGTVREVRSAGDDAAMDELTPEDLGRIRFLLDRALQPVGAYRGFEWIDQFQSAAVRYQLNFAGFALSLLQFTHLPAFGGYLTQAQANLIEKQRDRRIWRYWALENLWGNLRIGGNPFERDNIMFGGFCAAQIALFQAASNDLRFSAPGSFSLRGPNSEAYPADFPTLVASMVEQHRQSHFGLIACEPNWIFPVCNTIGFAGIRHHDVRFGTRYWETESPRLRRLLQNEFVDAAGHFITCRSSYTGFAMPPIGGGLTKALPGYFLNATMPDIARRNWQSVRSSIFPNADGKHSVDPRAFWPIDVGNYRFTRMAGLAGTAAVACELGDAEVRDALLGVLDATYPARDENGVFHRPNASIWAHAMEVIARCGRANALRDLIGTGTPARGVRLEGCAYPNVLVAKAVSRDGGLDAVLYPGNGGRTETIRIAGLAADSVYRCTGGTNETVRSDAEGRARLAIRLKDRTPVTITPAEACG